MNASEHTRAWFYGGGFHHLIASQYLTCREYGCNVLVAGGSAAWLVVLIGWDWIRLHALGMEL